mgnify:CR=1 FL=1|tara:strand:- start:296 stop:1096 length:801 start_codon:yes stop_codon:yes gene_type:complete
MNYRKTISELLITFFISYFLYSLVDFSVFSIYEWDQDKVVNLIQTWATLISSYYIYNGCLKLAFVYWKKISIKKLILILFCISFIVIFWIIGTELLFYKLYYNISSLYDETTFFEFDLPFTIVLLTIGSLFFYQKYYIKPIVEEKNSRPQDLEKLTATKGKKQFFIDYNDIGLIYIENEIVIIRTLLGEKCYAEDSLSSIVNKLSNISFFRLNRQVIVSRIVIKEFEKLEFQKLRVFLIDDINYDKPIIISKYNAPAFKRWLTNSQ